jgi:hypothetical protein
MSIAIGLSLARGPSMERDRSLFHSTGSEAVLESHRAHQRDRRHVAGWPFILAAVLIALVYVLYHRGVL